MSKRAEGPLAGLVFRYFGPDANAVNTFEPLDDLRMPHGALMFVVNDDFNDRTTKEGLYRSNSHQVNRHSDAQMFKPIESFNRLGLLKTNSELKRHSHFLSLRKTRRDPVNRPSLKGVHCPHKTNFGNKISADHPTQTNNNNHNMTTVRSSTYCLALLLLGSAAATATVRRSLRQSDDPTTLTIQSVSPTLLSCLILDTGRRSILSSRTSVTAS